MHNIETLFSHESDEWTTPQDFYEELDEEFHFDLDVAADKNNHKCDKYFTAKEDGLSQNWGGVGYSATHPIVKSVNGLQKRSTKLKKIILL